MSFKCSIADLSFENPIDYTELTNHAFIVLKSHLSVERENIGQFF